MRKRILVLAAVTMGQLALAAVAPTARASAQESRGEPPAMWRRWVFGAMGAVVGGLPMLFADGQSKAAWCQSATCSALTTGLVAGGVGYLIGRERDLAVLERWKLGPTLERQAETRRLELPATRLVAHPNGGVLVIGEWGLSVVDGRLAALRRGGRIRGVRDVAAVPARNALIAATEAGIYSFPLGASAGIGRRLLPAPATALALLPPAGLVTGAATNVKRIILRPGAAGPEAVESARAPVADTVNAVAYAAVNGSVWTIEGRRLQGRAASTLEPLGALELPSGGSGLVIEDELAACAAGADGVYLIDIADPRNPRLIEHVDVDALPFALDIALRDGRLYIAGGPQGLVVLDVRDPVNSRVLGVVRGIGSVDEVVAGREGVLVLDRDTHQVRRVRIAEPRSAGGQ